MKRINLRFGLPVLTRARDERCLFCLLLLTLVGRGARAQDTNVPALGSQVSPRVLKARLHAQECPTDINHRDPCASIKIKNVLFTIAWDKDTKAITYLFTDDRTFVTNSELSVGGECRLLDEGGTPEDVAQYMGWLVTPKWSDTEDAVSGKTIWYAALRRGAKTGYGTIVGFVQSRYLKLGQ